jgi:erythromycin esterase
MTTDGDDHGDDDVVAWIRATAHPLGTTAADGDLDDLEPLREIAGHATVVGLGGSTRQAHELLAVQHRIVRFLVEELGFRAVALEMSATVGHRLDEHIRTGTGTGPDDVVELLAAARPFWRFGEIVELVRWLRDHARDHPDDPVRLLGADTDVADLGALAPDDPVADQVEARDPELAARPDTLGYTERHLAETAIRWHERTGARIVHWGGSAHVAVGDRRIAAVPPGPPLIDRNAGSYLRERFGPGYLAVGLTFDHGDAPYPVPPASPPLVDATLARAGLDAYLLDLHAPRPPAVERWLTAPARARLIGPRYDATRDAEHHLAGAALAEWYDVLVHVQEVTPAR